MFSFFGLAGCLRWPTYLGCFAITTVFSHAQTVVLCGACSSVLCQPTGGKARLTEGLSYPCSKITQASYILPQVAHTAGRTRFALFWVYELSYCIVLHTHYLVLLAVNINGTLPVSVPPLSDSGVSKNAGGRPKVFPASFPTSLVRTPGLAQLPLARSGQ